MHGKQTKNSLRQRRCLRVWAACVVAFFICLLPLFSGAAVLKQESIYIKNAQTALLICTDEKNDFESAYLLAVSENAVGILPLPGSARVQQIRTETSGAVTQLYAPLAQAYDRSQEDPAQHFAQSVRYLLSGVSIDRIVTFSAQQIEQIADQVGGISLEISDLPEVSIYEIGADQVYPFDDSNDPMALLLRSRIDAAALEADYDLDVGRALRKGGVLPEQVSLSGKDARAVFEYYAGQDENTLNLPMIHRQQQVLLGLMRQICALDAQSLASLGLEEPLAQCMASFADFDAALLPRSGILPLGYLLETGEAVHWVFDSTLLRNWIFEYIYCK